MESSFSRTICGMCWPRMPASAMYWSVNSARARGPGRTPRDEVLEIEDLHALVPQDLGEGVVLLLRDLQERDVVEQESLELVGRQVEELVAGTVQADLPELADLGRHVQTFRHGLLPFFRAYWPNVSAPLRMGRCLLTALVISKNHLQFHLAPERSAKCDERYISYDSPMMHFGSLKQVFKGKCSFF